MAFPSHTRREDAVASEERERGELHGALDKLTLGAGRAESGARPKGKPRFRVIMACTNASRDADRAIAWASHLAELHHARVIVASVYTPPQLDAGMATGYAFYPGYAASYADLEDAIKRVAERDAAMLRARGIDAQSVVSAGSPAYELSAIATTHGADLVVLGARSHGAVQTALFGSTADTLLDRVPASVLVARTDPPSTQILAATDGSHASYRAVGYALQEASDAEADVTVQHVVDYPEGAADIPTAGLLRDVIARMDLTPNPHVSYHLDAGRPADRILARARELDAGLIVLGSRGVGRVKGWLTGSVSRRVAASAPSSVLVVKDPPSG